MLIHFSLGRLLKLLKVNVVESTVKLIVPPLPLVMLPLASAVTVTDLAFLASTSRTVSGVLVVLGVMASVEGMTTV